MKKIIFLLFFTLQLGYSQVRLSQIEPYKIAGVRIDSGLVMTNANGVLQFIKFDTLFQDFMIDCDKVEECLLEGGFICDIIDSCLTVGGALCDALNDLDDMDIDVDGKFVWIDAEGICHTGDISSVPGVGFNCDSVQYCLENGGFLCEIVDSCLANSNFICELIDSCLTNGGFHCELIDSCLADNGFLCAQIDSCLSDGLLCDLLGDIAMGTTADGDKVVVVAANGDCKTVSLDSLGGGMDSLNCDAVLECLVGGTLCEALDSTADLPNELDSLDEFLVLRDGTCYKGTIGDIWGGLCDSLSRSNCKITYKCNATGQTQQVFYTQVLQGDDLIGSLNDNSGACTAWNLDMSGLRGIDTIYSDNACGPPSIIYKKQGNTYNVNLSTYTLGFTNNGSGLITLTLYSDGQPCSNVIFSVCDDLSGCANNPLTAGSVAPAEYPNIYSLSGTGLKKYKSKKEALKDPNLRSGDLYIINGSDGIKYKE